MSEVQPVQEKDKYLKDLLKSDNKESDPNEGIYDYCLRMENERRDHAQNHLMRHIMYSYIYKTSVYLNLGNRDRTHRKNLAELHYSDQKDMEKYNILLTKLSEFNIRDDIHGIIFALNEGYLMYDLNIYDYEINVPMIELKNVIMKEVSEYDLPAILKILPMLEWLSIETDTKLLQIQPIKSGN